MSEEWLFISKFVQRKSCIVVEKAKSFFLLIHFADVHVSNITVTVLHVDVNKLGLTFT